MTGDDGDLRKWEAKRLSDEIFDGAIGAAIFGRLGNFDFQGGTQGSGDLRAAGIGDHFDMKEKTISVLHEHGCGRVYRGRG